MSDGTRPRLQGRRGSGLGQLLGLPDAGMPDIVSGITLDSRQVRRGDLYAALPGLNTHGARFAGAAIDSGACAILTDAEGRELIGRVDIPVLVVERPRRVLGAVSAWVYGNPADKLTLVGITGTNGKTTTSYLVDAALQAAGHQTGMIGTVATTIGSRVLPSARTTPEAPELHAILAMMLAEGVSAVTMEVSSHAMSMGRVDGLCFDLALFTNFSQDHLDFHHTMDEYFHAKAALFSPDRARQGVVCIDDEAGRRLVAQADIPVTTYGMAHDATWRALDCRVGHSGGTDFSIRIDGPTPRQVRASVALPGRFNAANALGATCVASKLGIDVEVAAEAIAACPGVPGRMEPILAGQAFLAVVDYAHTPDAIQRAIGAAREATSGQVIVVLGCGGDRDRAKRPLMGRAGAQLADVLIITDDNPRSEPPAQIRAAVVAGAMGVSESQRAEVIEVGDRRAAISAAVQLAATGDAVLLLGKGHEKGQEVAGVMVGFDDRQELRSAIELRHQ